MQWNVTCVFFNFFWRLISQRKPRKNMSYNSKVSDSHCVNKFKLEILNCSVIVYVLVKNHSCWRHGILVPIYKGGKNSVDPSTARFQNTQQQGFQSSMSSITESFN